MAFYHEIEAIISFESTLFSYQSTCITLDFFLMYLNVNCLYSSKYTLNLNFLSWIL